MKTAYRIFLLFVVLCASGCTEFLSERPSKNKTIEDVSELAGLFENYSTFCITSDNKYLPVMTDHAYLPLEYVSDEDNIAFYTYNLPRMEKYDDWATFFRSHYHSIYVSNLTFEYLDQVSGDPQEKAHLEALAHLSRAFDYWYLANSYCMPYAAGKNEEEPGLPYKVTTSYTDPLNRVPVKQIYDLIFDDLDKACLDPQEDVSADYPWRGGRTAAHALSARIYLEIADYAKALEHAEAALQSKSRNLLDYSTIELNVEWHDYENPADTVWYSEIYDWDEETILFLEDVYMPRFAAIYPRIMSQSLVDLFDMENDYRVRVHFAKNYNRRSSITSEHFYGWSCYRYGGYYSIGPSVSEMLLIKAECLARMGDVSGAMAAVNQLHASRMANGERLTASSKEEALKQVLDERRRELPWHRWWDIRRFSVNDDPSDDVDVVHRFYPVNADGIVDRNAQPVEHKMPSGSRLYATPIPIVEITASRGQMEQNTY